MRLMFKRLGFPMILRNADGGGSGGGDGGNESNANAEPESLLFPNEGKEGEGEGESQTDPNAGKEGEGNSDWQEYKPDPNKTDEENAAAKAEHDKTKPADDKDKNDPANQVPEDGKYTLTMPEGVEVDQELLDALGPKFAAKKLTNAEAQELADEFIKLQQKRGETRMKEWGETVQGWVDEAKADKEIGGTNFDGTVKNAQRFLTAHGTPELREYLNASGGGNHPELIRVFAKAGAMIREDNPAAGGAEGSSKPVDAAHALFPTDAPKG